MQTTKRKLKLMKNKNVSFDHMLADVLLQMRSTPNSTTGISLGDLFLKRRIRTQLDYIHPQIASTVENHQMEQMKQKRGLLRKFDVNLSVWVRSYGRYTPWCRGNIIDRLSPVSYKVQVNGMIWKRHVDQLKERFISQTQRNSPQNLTTGIPDTSVMEKDIPVSEMLRSEPVVNDQSGETDKTEFASQQQQEQPSTVYYY